MRSKKALYNMLANALQQIISLVCGFILPRLILSRFGSSYNGITTSITQFLSVIALLRAGVGGATRAALYKTLANDDVEHTSSIIRATEIFMRKISLVFAGFILVFACVYPFFVAEEFDWIFSATLVLIISASTFMQYYFGITYQMLLQADQRQYIYSILHCLTTALNTGAAAVMISLGLGIHAVKLGSSLIFCITPLFLNYYVKRKYTLNTKVEPDFSSIKQRWDSFFHQVAGFVHTNTSVTLLTIFTNMKEVSVYSVYHLVSFGLRNAMYTIITGVEAAFGNMLAKGEKNTLRRNLDSFEALLHFCIGVVFSVALVLITPFVKVYTHGVTDVNYERYLFGYLILIGEMLYCARTPYESIINAAGRFKETKKYAFWEMVINICVSLTLVAKYSVVGVVLGTVVSILFKTICFSLFVSRNIIERPFLKIIKRYGVTSVGVLAVVFISKYLVVDDLGSYYKLIIYAVEITLVSLAVNAVSNALLFKEQVADIFAKVKRILKKG